MNLIFEYFYVLQIFLMEALHLYKEMYQVRVDDFYKLKLYQLFTITPMHMVQEFRLLTHLNFSQLNLKKREGMYPLNE